MDLTGSPWVGRISAFMALVIVVGLSSLTIFKTFRLLDFLAKKHSSLALVTIAFTIFALADFLVSWLTPLPVLSRYPL